MKKIWTRSVLLSVSIVLIAVTSARGGTIRVLTLDEKTSTAISVSVLLHRWNAQTQSYDWWSSDWTNGQGLAVFSYLPPGAYNVRAGRLGDWTMDYYNLSKAYYQEYYKDIPGHSYHEMESTPVVVTATGTARVRMNLKSTPVSLAVLAVNDTVPPEGGQVRFKVKIRNWTSSTLSLKRWAFAQWCNDDGVWFTLPMQSIDFTLGPRTGRIFTYLLNVPMNTKGYGSLHVQVGPSGGEFGEIYGRELARFYKSPAAP